VEIQLLADRHGTVVSLGERECSLQRRHQKVLEESPSPALGPELRAAMGEAAVAFACAVGYESAGPAEFMLDDDRFSVLELNARLQGEHPVTELVSGLDLVEQQLRVAEGARLDPVPPEPEGHAVEVRLYAEHPLTFLPQAGRLELLHLPDTVRVDAGVEAGDEIPVAYDPLIAKLSARAETRAEAFDDLSRALRVTRVAGATTNLGFLRWLVDHPAVRAGETTTAFLSDHPPLSPPTKPSRSFSGYWRLNRDRRAAAPEPRPAPTVEAAAHATHGAHETSSVVAPMPGVVIRVLTEEGDRVEARQPLVVLEAMKMETPLASPYEAVVKHVHVAEGDRVAGGALLVELED
jgi:acetyl/propionyl-CoA carboxylase alpha subunit